MPQTEPSNRKGGCCNFFVRVWDKYDHAFLFVYCFQYFNAGQQSLLVLATLDLFKNYYGLEPATVQYLTMIMFLPWSVKVLWGIIADTVQVCGSRKKSWLIINGFIQFSVLMILASVRIKSASFATALLTLVLATGAFMDVIVDALMVIQAKRDPENGSQEL